MERSNRPINAPYRSYQSRLILVNQSEHVNGGILVQILPQMGSPAMIFPEKHYSIVIDGLSLLYSRIDNLTYYFSVFDHPLRD